MTEPHTTIVQGSGAVKALRLARSIDAVLAMMAEDNRVEITAAQLTALRDAFYERAGKVEERR